MAKVKKAQLGIRTRPPEKEKSPAGKNVVRFQKNPFTGAKIMKEKDVEYKTKESPRRVYKSKIVSTPESERETRVLKEDGKVLKRYDRTKQRGKNINSEGLKKFPFLMENKKRSGGKIKPNKKSN